MPKVSYQHLFVVPFASCVWNDCAELNAAVLGRVFAHEKVYRGDNRSNVGGWRSETGQLEFLGEPGRELLVRLQAAAHEASRQVFTERGLAMPELRWQVQAWANVCRSGNFNSAHNHPGATWSGVYYVDAGEPTSDAHSQLHLIAPDQARSSTFFSYLLPDTVCINPKAGMMVLFPGYLLHAVVPHLGKRPRVSIAFNLRTDPFP